jgi:hypothetical protein
LDIDSEGLNSGLEEMKYMVDHINEDALMYTYDLN